MYALSNVSYAVGPGLRFPDEYGFPRFDQLPQNAPIDLDAPLVAGTIRGQPIVLAQRQTPSGRTVTQPITLSRLRRAIDLERGYDPGPFVPSALDGAEDTMDWTAVLLGALLVGAAGTCVWLIADTHRTARA